MSFVREFDLVELQQHVATWVDAYRAYIHVIVDPMFHLLAGLVRQWFSYQLPEWLKDYLGLVVIVAFALLRSQPVREIVKDIRLLNAVSWASLAGARALKEKTEVEAYERMVKARAEEEKRESNRSKTSETPPRVFEPIRPYRPYMVSPSGEDLYRSADVEDTSLIGWRERAPTWVVWRGKQFADLRSLGAALEATVLAVCLLIIALFLWPILLIQSLVYGLSFLFMDDSSQTHGKNSFHFLYESLIETTLWFVILLIANFTLLRLGFPAET